MIRRFRSLHARLGVIALLGCGTACSLILKADPLPCSTNADCAKLSGAICDVGSGQCVAGTSVEPDGSVEGDGSVPTQDGSPPGTDGATEDAADSTVDGGTDTGVDATIDAPDTSDAGKTGPDWDLVASYLLSLYDPNQAMVRRWPTSSEFWTTNDNILVGRALAYLPNPKMTESNAILSRIGALKTCGCGDDFGHSADKNHLVDPVVHKGAQIPLIPDGACFGEPSNTSSCAAGFDAGAGVVVCSATVIRTEDHADLGWGADSCNATCGGTKYPNWNDAGQGNGYADLIALEILNYRNRGMDTTALYANLLAKWDGRGMRDTITAGGAQYQTYKLALFRLVTRVLGKPIPAGVDEILIASQNLNGGIRTSYALDGTFSIDQAGSAEATGYVALAFLKPINDF